MTSNKEIGKPLEGELLPPNPQSLVRKVFASESIGLAMTNRMRTRAIVARAKVEEANESLAKAREGRARAWNRLDQLDGILATDNLKLANEYNQEATKARHAKLDSELAEERKLLELEKIRSQREEIAKQKRERERLEQERAFSKQQQKKMDPMKRIEERLRKRAEAQEFKRGILEEFKENYKDSMSSDDLERFLAQCEAEVDASIDKL